MADHNEQEVAAASSYTSTGRLALLQVTFNCIVWSCDLVYF